MIKTDYLKSEINQFREIGHQFLKKELTVVEFKGKSGGMGVYAQRGGESFMIRLRTPSGVVTHKHLELINHYAEEYNLNRIHLTTRQAIQLHDLSIDDVCDIMEDAMDHGLYTRGGGGNYPRNVSLSPLSGVEKGEAFDVTPYALQVNDYLMENMTEYHLPRKLKIAFSNSDVDSANATINDLGFLAVVKDNQPYFQVYITGGLGNNPAVAIPFDELVKPEDVLYHIEAFIQFFMAEGNYENKAKARSRYIQGKLGIKECLEVYKKHLNKVKETFNFNGISTKLEVEENNGENNVSLSEKLLKEVENRSLIPQKQKDLFTVVIHPQSGQLPAEALKKITDFVLLHKEAEIRLTMTESMYIRNLTEKEAEELLDLTKEIRMISKVERSVSCIGVPTCQIGIDRSQELLDKILTAIKEKEVEDRYLPSIHISGCGNSCSRHQVSDLGFAGKRKKVNDVLEDVFELYVGGVVEKGKTKLGYGVGLLIDREIPSFICELANELEKYDMEFPIYLDENKESFEHLVAKYSV